MNWLFRRIERFHARIRLFRLDAQREQMLARLTCVPDGPLKRPILQELERIDQAMVQTRLQTYTLSTMDQVEIQVDQAMAGVRAEVNQKMQEREAEPWSFEVPTEEDKTVPRSKIRIED